MDKIKEKDSRFKYLEVKVGIMALIAIIGIIILIVLVGREKDLFTPKYRLHFVSMSGTGFTEGMPVKLSGFKIGRVKSIELTDDAKVKVTTEINKKYERWVREGSKARLSKEGLIGESIIEVTVGNPAGKVFADGELIPFEKTGGIEELVEEAKPVLEEVKEIIHYANSPEGDIKQALGNIKDLTAELKETRKTIEITLKKTNNLIDNVNSKTAPAADSALKIMKNLEGVSERIGPVMTRIEGITVKADTVAEKLPATLDKFEKTVNNIKNITDTFAGETPRMREMLINADDTLRDGKTIMRGVKQSWPVRLMVPQPKDPGLVPLDGYLFDRRMNEVEKKK
ncbi:MAG: MCE family protein [Deltaproteobacteria bacterium]|nr:MCE family protein [Deltaproteobacteria bacterium]